MTTVLIVDDSAFMRMRSTSLVQGLGYQTVEACDGREAVEVYRRSRPQAVLMDITMPKADGLAALREIMDFDPNANVAMVTAVNQQGPTMEALKAGARAFVVKPFQPESVKAALMKLTASRRRS